MKDKLETYLGFAIRSGNIVYGVDLQRTPKDKVTEQIESIIRR